MHHMHTLSKMVPEQPPDTCGYEILCFGRFRLDPVKHELCEGGKPARLGSRALEILIALAERSGQVVSKNELLARVWPKSVVQESTLRVHIAALRKALGDGEYGTRYVENYSGRGYRFVAPVIRRQEGVPLETPAGTPGTSSTGEAAYARNLPIPLSRIVGRAHIISTLASRAPQRRFVSIVGPGGIGKTTVATTVAEKLTGTYEHGVRFVDLSLVSEARQLPGALASVLELGPVPDDALPGVLAFLNNKSMLLVLDNCEHVVEAAAAIAEKLLQAAPGLHLLATSREPLRAESEYIHRLAPLEAPAPSATMTLAEALRFPAIELFLERALASLDSFELHDSEIPLVAQICSRLEGNPLAIELAAARVDLFRVRGLAARLDDCLELLTRGRRTALPRHQSLRASLDWSYGLLSKVEQVVLRRLAVFSGSFDLESANAVAPDERIRAEDVFNTLANLVAKSLLTTDTTGEQILYRLSDTTRAYALEKLQDSEELAKADKEQPQLWDRSEAAA
jgi:predicted ATPase/DNA-binding winged helix-turn-helix (wHTH) protein